MIQAKRMAILRLPHFPSLPQHVTRYDYNMKRMTLLFLLLLCARVALAQTQPLTDFERSRYSPASYYRFAEPGELTIVASVWGNVRNPGLYEVPQGTRLGTLLSLAGGPTVGTRTRRQERTVTLKLSRPRGDAPPETIFHEEMENEISAASQNVLVQDGDVLTVEMVLRQGFSWRDMIPVVAAIGTIALALERLSN